MANSRMLSKTIILSDQFVELPHSAQALYLQFSLEADDDGFVGNNIKRIMRSCDCKEEDLKCLIENGFVYQFQSGVVLILHWLLNNHIPYDKYHETVFAKEKSMIRPFRQPSEKDLATLIYNMAYTVSEDPDIAPELTRNQNGNDLSPEQYRFGSVPAPQNRINENSLSLGETIIEHDKPVSRGDGTIGKEKGAGKRKTYSLQQDSFEVNNDDKFDSILEWLGFQDASIPKKEEMRKAYLSFHDSGMSDEQIIPYLKQHVDL